MIEISMQDIVIDFGFKKIIDGLSFVVQTGEKTALVGGNGTGKTTLLRIIMGLQKCEKGQFTIRKGASIAYLDQNSDIADESLRVENFIKEAQKPIFDLETKLRDLESRMAVPIEEKQLDKLLLDYSRIQNEFLSLNGYETDENFSKICTVFKFNEEFLQKKCGELSGGQKTIVKLAKVLLQAPDILLLDEPTNHLDIDTLEWLETFIRNYKGTVLLVSHDRYFLDKTAEKTILLYQGKAELYHGNYSFCIKEQERLMQLEFEKYKNQQRTIEAMKEAIKKYRQWGEMAPQNKSHFIRAKNVEKMLDRLEKIDKPKLERDKLPIHFEMGKRSAKRVLSLKDLSFSYDDTPLFMGAEMDLLFQERLCLFGANGVGKSTMLKLLLGQLTLQEGEIAIAESARLGYIEQEVAFKDESQTILAAFQEHARVHENDARKILARYFITRDEVYKRLHSLSGGERLILRLAMLMQQAVNFLILDEPTNHLDIDTKELLEESLADYKGSLLFISHDRYFINRLATRIVYIEDKRLKSVDGNFDDFFASRYG